jgi:hypothetical protein
MDDRIRQLARTRQQLASRPAEEIMAAILEHPRPAALVHSYSEQDLHFLVHEIGPESALPLLALASNRQWEYMLDMEVWRRDRFDFQQITGWLLLLLNADADRLVRWCFDEKLEFTELYLFRNIELRILETDQAPSDFGEGFFTDDDTFYVRMVDYPVTTPEEANIQNLRNEMVSQLLRRLSMYDHPRYQGLLMEAMGLIPSEVEEEEYRLRNVRLAEKGFKPFDEAVGVYQPLRREELESRPKKVFSKEQIDDARFPVPQFAFGFPGGDNLFVRALKGIQAPSVVQQLQVELAALCNQVVTADGQTIRGRAQLAGVVTMVSGYLSIGLESLVAASKPRQAARAARHIQDFLLEDIFRFGFARVLELKWRAGRWLKKSWCQAQRIGLAFWGEEWLGMLGGLLIEKPQFYDSGGTESNYRAFAALKEIEAVGRVLQQVETLDRLLGNMETKIPSSGRPRTINYKNLLLTLWARENLQLPLAEPRDLDLAIPLVKFKPFYQSLWIVKEEQRIIGNDRKTDFLAWVSKKSGVAATDLSGRLGAVFETLFNEIESELGSVKAGNLDPRNVSLFLLRP